MVDNLSSAYLAYKAYQLTQQRKNISTGPKPARPELAKGVTVYSTKTGQIIHGNKPSPIPEPKRVSSSLTGPPTRIVNGVPVYRTLSSGSHIQSGETVETQESEAPEQTDVYQDYLSYKSAVQPINLSTGPKPKAPVSVTSQTKKQVQSESFGIELPSDTTSFELLPESKPINISKTQLEKTNQIRSGLGLEPLENVIPLYVYDEAPSNTAEKIISEGKAVGATDIQIYATTGESIGSLKIGSAKDTLSTLLTAGDFQISYTIPSDKEKNKLESFQFGSGILGSDKLLRKIEGEKFQSFISEYEKKGAVFDITDKEGNFISTISKPSKFDILKAQEKHGEIKVQPRFLLENSLIGKSHAPNLIKTAVASFAQPASYIGVTVLAGIGDLTGGKLGIRSGVTEQETSLALKQTYGETYLDQLLSGQRVTFTPEQQTASLVGGGTFFGLGFFGGGKGGVKGTAKVPEAEPIPIKSTLLSRLSPSQRNALKFAEGTREGTQPYQIAKIKGTNVFEFEQGVEPSTIKPSEIIEPKISGFTSKGQAVYQKVPENIKIPEPQAKEAEIPLAIMELKGGTAFIRNQPFEKFAATKAMIKGVEPSLAKSLGLKQLAGTKDVYIGEITPQTRSLLEGAVKSKAIQPITDIYQFPTSDVLRGKGIYQFATRNPSQFAKLSNLVKPVIVRYYEGKNIGLHNPRYSNIGERVTTKSGIELGSRGLERKLREINLSIGRNAAKGFTKMKPMDIGNISEGKVGAGSSGKAQSLSKEKVVEIKNLIRTSNIMATPKVSTDYLGLRSIGVMSGVSGKYSSNDELVYEYVAYPPQTNIKVKLLAVEKPLTNLGVKIKVAFEGVQSQRTKMVQVGGLESQQKQGVGPKTILKTGPKFRIGYGVTQRTQPRYRFVPTYKLITEPKIPVPLITKYPVPTRTTIKVPPIGGLSGWTGGSSSGGKKKRSRGSPFFFIYSVNPNISGAIEQAGFATKISSVSIADIEAFEIRLPKGQKYF